MSRKIQIIKFPKISLSWSKWERWDRLAEDGSENLKNEPGVYEVTRKPGSKKRLTIGKAVNLHQRVLRGLVLGKLSHSTGERIRINEKNIDKLYVRWAATEYPAACEEYLHKEYVAHYGKLPEQTKIT
ncbi:hypothetical protein [Microbulbifer sp. ANSA005]|uniref:hypothetical protein n=1 Tax=Microbulbifer sp. ANSA005 TaxID=3243362 RepID=UPI0040430F64